MVISDYITPVMFTDSTGYAPKWLKFATVAIIAIVAIAITVSTVGVGMPLAAGAIYGTISASAQISSNNKHNANTFKNVVGAFVGGFVSGTTFGNPLGQIIGAFVNAGINEVENTLLHNIDDKPFNYIGIIYEGVIYSAANLAQSAIPIFPMQIGSAYFIDFYAFDYSDTNKNDDIKSIKELFQYLVEKIGDVLPV